MTNKQYGCAALLSFVLCLLACASYAATVTGPITGGKRGKPFNSPELDLAKHGYVAEEFFVEGTASAYELVPGTQQESDGRWQLQKRKDTAPFRTRILVVRPSDAKKFNGTVVVHWQNVTAGYELGGVAEGNEYLRGFAWVGVSAQKVGIDGFPGPDAAGLKQWDPDRYGSLNHPGDDYSFDIYAQAGRLVGPHRLDKSERKIDPMGKLPVKRLIAAGASQSAGRLRAYIDGIHRLDHVFDAYIPYIDFARSMPFGPRPATPAPAPNPTALNSAAPILNRANVIVRTDLDVPVFVVNSETESEGYVVSRQPNTDKFRFWEVPGSSHVNVSRALIGHPEKEMRAGLKISDLASPNWLSYRPAYDAAVRHMHVWLTTGKAPPEAPLIEMASTNPAKIARDAKGNALGGIRLPDFAVASAEHRGNGNTKPGGYRLGFLYGFSREFTDKELAELYPNSADFMKKYDQALNDVVKKGYVLQEDGPGMRAVAAEWAKKLDGINK
jgi:hypothetical protein